MTVDTQPHEQNYNIGTGQISKQHPQLLRPASGSKSATKTGHTVSNGDISYCWHAGLGGPGIATGPTFSRGPASSHGTTSLLHRDCHPQSLRHQRPCLLHRDCHPQPPRHQRPCLLHRDRHPQPPCHQRICLPQHRQKTCIHQPQMGPPRHAHWCTTEKVIKTASL